MKLNKFVFIFFIFFGFILILNINSFHKNILTFSSYLELKTNIVERGYLYEEIHKQENVLNELNDKLNNYKKEDSNYENIIKYINKEINKNKKILGKTDVTGKGIEININDAPWDNTEKNALITRLRIVHNIDILNVINDLKYSGAEAISINNERILGNSEVYCSAAFLTVNNVKLYAPFSILAIGNQEEIKTYMLRKDGYLYKFINERGIEVELKEKDNVNIKGYKGNIHFKFLRNNS